MRILSADKLKESILSCNDGIYIDPLLSEDQIGGVTLDVRLGYDFLVSIVTRKPSILLGGSANKIQRSIDSYFRETRREIGEKFILYPNQVVLTTTLEYVSLPENIYADVLTRSSYTRLGIHINTMVQPGFKGCVPLELYNHGNNAIELVVGSRMCQLRFYEIDDQVNYLNNGVRKYYGDVRPSISRADKDGDLEILQKIKESDI